MRTNFMELPGTNVFHANSPFGVNRSTRRNWDFRLKKKRGARYTKSVVKQHKGIHGKLEIGMIKALEDYKNVVDKWELSTEYQYSSKGLPFKKIRG